MHLTYEQMVDTLIDKGHSREWSEKQASHDYILQSLPSLDQGYYDCSICRQEGMTPLEWRYHYHPCE